MTYLWGFKMFVDDHFISNLFLKLEFVYNLMQREFMLKISLSFQNDTFKNEL